MERIGGQFDEDCTVISRLSIYFINNKLKWEDTAFITQRSSNSLDFCRRLENMKIQELSINKMGCLSSMFDCEKLPL